METESENDVFLFLRNRGATAVIIYISHVFCRRPADFKCAFPSPHATILAFHLRKMTKKNTLQTNQTSNQRTNESIKSFSWLKKILLVIIKTILMYLSHSILFLNNKVKVFI